MTDMNIRDRIVDARRDRVNREGHELGHPVPSSRQVPLVPFGRDPFLICEIKRKSPSRGDISAGLDPVEQATRYWDSGVRSISVLTEEDHFAGSLSDLMAVKSVFPDVAALRKDFLIDEQDIVVSHRAGADAVLLIASLFSPERFARLHSLATDLGMRVLVEVHDAADVDVVRPAKPDLVGINSRDLRTFRVDRLTPARLRSSVDWDTQIVFESGIWHEEDVLYARSTGFSGVLVGESVTRNPGVIPHLIEGFQAPVPKGGFWTRVAARVNGDRPMVKICGIVRETDGRMAVDLAADLLGFVFADSPRRADPAVVRTLADLEVGKVAVVVTDPARPALPPEVDDLLSRGYLDAVQFHGDEEPEACFRLHFPYFKAVRLKDSGSVKKVDAYRSPRVLVDAYSDAARGGTGRAIAADLVDEVRARHPLWLAGGLNPSNIRQLVQQFSPELVDASSGLEDRPGSKNQEKLRTYFREILNAKHR